jgi:glycosyltransferase involved in cell wall biosynthesis
MKITILMPAYNEERHIQQGIKGIVNIVSKLGYDYEVIIIDDGSTDNTRNVAEKIANNPHVQVIGYTENRGKGNAIKYGLKHSKGDYVVFWDSDWEIEPLEFSDYITSLQHADIVIGSKRHPESLVETPFMRKFLSYGFNLLIRLALGIKITDTQTGFKAFRRERLEQIIHLMYVTRYAFDAELFVLAELLKMRIVELPIEIHLSARLIGTNHILRILFDMAGIAYRLRILRWYQKNLTNKSASYKPLLRL